ncbi:N-lysine methyltransferase KMT5A-B-like isoform X2 [Zophobas morio]|uniref:N-lysine methyltransferase KMT5A-B-like isoform X2 n=1 Tax=Zophobas morio TaxID=2755281 RepID=UPI00308353F0
MSKTVDFCNTKSLREKIQDNTKIKQTAIDLAMMDKMQVLKPLKNTLFNNKYLVPQKTSRGSLKSNGESKIRDNKSSDPHKVKTFLPSLNNDFSKLDLFDVTNKKKQKKQSKPVTPTNTTSSYRAQSRSHKVTSGSSLKATLKFKKHTSLTPPSTPDKQKAENLKKSQLNIYFTPTKLSQRKQSRKERLKYKEKKTIERGKGKYSQKELSYYFPARKSNRVSSNQRKKENEEQLQKIILGSVEYDLEVSDEGDKGKGVRTLREFSKGDFICEYSGELIGKKEADLREVKYGKDPECGCYMYYFKFKENVHCVDATLTGRIGRFINHSAKAALFILSAANLVTKAMEVSGVPRLFFFAKRHILKGEELLYDYGDRSKLSLKNHPWLRR